MWSEAEERDGVLEQCLPISSLTCSLVSFRAMPAADYQDT